MIETPAMREAFEVIGFSGFALFLVGWLVVSFRKPGPLRELIEWLSTCALYLVLLSLFTHLTLRALEDGSIVRLVAFGFFVLFFTSGFLVCLSQTLASLRGGSAKRPESATN